MAYRKFPVLLMALALMGMGKGPAKAPNANDRPRTTILVTGFDPFGGERVNHSWLIAQQLQKNAPKISANLDIELCRLPVVYDEGAKTAEKCFESLPAGVKPRFVLSMGEGACDFRLETAASNLDNTPGAPDNAGDERVNHVIEPGGPSRVGLSLPAQRMYCAIPQTDRKVDILASISPGFYVCNNTAYNLARYFNPRGVQYGFVHVPASSCPSDVADVGKNTQRMMILIQAALAFDATRVAADYPLPHPSNAEVFPGTKEELAALLEKPEISALPACEDQFLKALNIAYQSPL